MQKEADRIVKEGGADDDKIITHLSHILKGITKNTARKFAIALADYLPYRLREKFIISVMHKHIIHQSLLHTLNTIGYGNLGGAVIIDQLFQKPDTHPILDEYLSSIPTYDAQDFVHFAVPLIGKSSTEVKDIIRNHPHIHPRYLETESIEENIKPIKIANLIAKVCESKNLITPDSVKIIRVEYYFQFICDQFEQKNLHSGDILSMVREAIHRSALPPTIAVDFFKNTLIEIAEQLAEKYNLPKPAPSAVPGVARLIPLRDWPCHPDHYKVMKKAMDGVNQIIINSDTLLEIFKAELEKNRCISLMHHEPPLTMPYKETHDMLTIRSAEHVFHVLTVANPGFARRVIHALQNFYNANGVIYARSPQGLIKILHDEYSWKPEICDIQPYVNEITGNVN